MHHERQALTCSLAEFSVGKLYSDWMETGFTTTSNPNGGVIFALLLGFTLLIIRLGQWLITRAL